MDRGDRTGLAIAAVALGAAVANELRKPAEQRTWHGKVLGVVPYDLRVPTIERLRQTYWNPAGQVLVPHAVGVGWTIKRPCGGRSPTTGRLNGRSAPAIEGYEPT